MSPLLSANSLNLYSSHYQELAKVLKLEQPSVAGLDEDLAAVDGVVQRVVGIVLEVVLLAERLQAVEEGGDALGGVAQLVAEEELEVNEYLVVAAAAGVNLLADIAQTLGEQQLHLAVDVLDALVDGEASGINVVEDGL